MDMEVQRAPSVEAPARSDTGPAHATPTLGWSTSEPVAGEDERARRPEPGPTPSEPNASGRPVPEHADRTEPADGDGPSCNEHLAAQARHDAPAAAGSLAAAAPCGHPDQDLDTEAASDEGDTDHRLPNAHLLAAAHRILSGTEAFGRLMPSYGTLRRWASEKRLECAVVNAGAGARRTLYDIQKLALLIAKLAPDRHLQEIEIARWADAQAWAAGQKQAPGGVPAPVVQTAPGAPVTSAAPAAAQALAPGLPPESPPAASVDSAPPVQGESPLSASPPAEHVLPSASSPPTTPPEPLPRSPLSPPPSGLTDSDRQLLVDIQQAVVAGMERIATMEVRIGSALEAIAAHARLVNSQTETVLKAVESLEGSRRALMLKYDAEHTMLREQLAQHRGMSRDGAAISMDLTRVSAAMNRLTERLSQLEEDTLRTDRSAG